LTRRQHLTAPANREGTPTDGLGSRANPSPQRIEMRVDANVFKHRQPYEWAFENTNGEMCISIAPRLSASWHLYANLPVTEKHHDAVGTPICSNRKLRKKAGRSGGRPTKKVKNTSVCTIATVPILPSRRFLLHFSIFRGTRAFYPIPKKGESFLALIVDIHRRSDTMWVFAMPPS
jgi:hypothetical protein